MRCLVATVLLAPILGCGARSQIDLARAGAGGGATAGGDPCPAAVSGPKPMARSCSTRDGRSRTGAPAAPHVTWTAALPTLGATELSTSAVATDAAGHAYVVTTSNVADAGELRRVRASDGSVDWTVPIAPTQETATPIVLSQGGIDLFAYDASTQDAVFTFDPATGASASTTFGFSLYDAPTDPAVGADGSLYVTHADDVGGAHTTTYVSRIAPGGQVLWTTVDLATLGPPPMFAGMIDPSIVALGQDDLAVVMVGVLTATGDVTVANAFDPATGAARWSTVLPGQIVGGPAVQADGTIVALLAVATAASVVSFDPASGAPTTTPLSTSLFELFAVTRDGVLLAGADTGNGVSGIVALRSDGTVLWTLPGADRAMVAGDGTILAFSPTLKALDPSTGTSKWELSPPTPGSCIWDAALASDGTLVALQCDGMLFGAGD
jgi:hypothetical protein